MATHDDELDGLDEGIESDGLEDASEAEVTCPYCGESVVIAIDASGGPSQEYVEDCEVCCRPWQVHVRFDEGGTPEVWLGESD